MELFNKLFVVCEDNVVENKKHVAALVRRVSPVVEFTMAMTDADPVIKTQLYQLPNTIYNHDTISEEILNSIRNRQLEVLRRGYTSRTLLIIQIWEDSSNPNGNPNGNLYCNRNTKKIMDLIKPLICQRVELLMTIILSVNNLRMIPPLIKDNDQTDMLL
jgi:hypothetical protein